MRHVFLALVLLGCGSEVHNVGQVEGSGEAGSSAEADGGTAGEGSGGSGGSGGSEDVSDASLTGFGRRDGGQGAEDGGQVQGQDGGGQDGGTDGGFDPSFFVGRWATEATAQTDCDGNPVPAATAKSELTVNSSFEVFGSSGTLWLKPGAFESDIWHPDPAWAGSLSDVEVWREGEVAMCRYIQLCGSGQVGSEVSMVWMRLAP